MSTADSGERLSRADVRGKEGDPGDLAGAIVSERAALVRRARLWTGDVTRAEDLVQETILRALMARARFRAGTNLPGWLRRIMRNLYIDGHRRKPVHTVLRPETPAAEREHQQGPLDLLEAEDVVQAMAHVEPRDREILILAHVNRCTYREISRRLGIPQATVGTRLFRARARLRPRMQAIYLARLGSTGSHTWRRTSSPAPASVTRLMDAR